MPVLKDGQAVGAIQEITLARFLHEGNEPSAMKVESVMARPLPTLDISTHLDEAFRMLQAGNTGVLVTENGKVVDIVARIDLIQYWNQRRKHS
jgi:cystathionine beta-synthase